MGGETPTPTLIFLPLEAFFCALEPLAEEGSLIPNQALLLASYEYIHFKKV